MSPFVKSFDSIFGSSIMDEAPMVRLVFEYMTKAADPLGFVYGTTDALARTFNNTSEAGARTLGREGAA